MTDLLETEASGLEGSAAGLITERTPPLALRPFLLAASVCSVLTLPVAWNARTFISNDGISYIDMAVSAIHNGPKPLLTNGSWSPGYPALLAVILRLAHPSPLSELAVLHSLDWLICTAAYFCFAFFLIQLVKWIRQAHGPVTVTGPGFLSLLIFAYTLLFVSNLDNALWRVGPNIMVEGIAYLIAGMYLRLSLPDARLRHFAALGALMAFAYVAKAVMFPLSLVLLTLLMLRPPSPRLGRKGSVVALAAFVLAASPLVASLSYNRGRLTFSDIGGLNFAWYVNDVPRYWDLQLPDSRLPHAPEIISTAPAIVRFDAPASQTYPYWDDPAWWYDGVHGHFDARRVVRQISRFLGLSPNPRLNSLRADRLFGAWIPIWAGLAVFVALGLRFGNGYRTIQEHAWLLLWPAAAVLTFACVHVEYRYLLPFLVLAWTSLFATAWVVIGGEKSTGVNLTVAACLLLIYGAGFAREAIQNQRQPRYPWPAIAAELRNLGIKPGDQLASVGFADFAYDARVVGARFTIQMPNGNGLVPPRGDPEYLSKTPEAEVRRILALLRASGARALFSPWRPAFDNDSGWVLVGARDYVRMLQ